MDIYIVGRVFFIIWLFQIKPLENVRFATKLFIKEILKGIVMHFFFVIKESQSITCSVASIPHSSFNLNDNITFKLMKRSRGSLIVYPANQIIREEKCLFKISDDSASSKYCKLLLANRIDVLNIIEREQRELEELLQADENAPEKCFIEQALESLNQRRDSVFTESSKEQTNTDTFNSVSESCKILDNLSLNTKEKGRNHLESISSDSITSEDFNESLVLADDLEGSASANQPPTKVFYFYQGS